MRFSGALILGLAIRGSLQQTPPTSGAAAPTSAAVAPSSAAVAPSSAPPASSAPQASSAAQPSSVQRQSSQAPASSAAAPSVAPSASGPASQSSAAGASSQAQAPSSQAAPTSAGGQTSRAATSGAQATSAATQGSSASRVSGSGTTLATATSGGSQTVGGSATSRSGSAATTTTTSSATAAVSSANLNSATVGQNAVVTQVSGKPAVVMNAPANDKSSFTVEAKKPDDVKPGESIRVLATIIVGPSGNGKRALIDRRQSGGVCQLQMQIDGTSVYDAQVSAAGAGGATMDIATDGAQAATDMPKINVTQICGSTPVEVTVTNMFVTSVNGGVMNPGVGPSSTGSGGGDNGGSTTSGTRTGSATTSTQSATGGGNNNNGGHSALDASRSSIWALCLMVPAVVFAL